MFTWIDSQTIFYKKATPSVATAREGVQHWRRTCVSRSKERSLRVFRPTHRLLCCITGNFYVGQDVSADFVDRGIVICRIFWLLIGNRMADVFVFVSRDYFSSQVFARNFFQQLAEIRESVNGKSQTMKRFVDRSKRRLVSLTKIVLLIDCERNVSSLLPVVI